VCFDVVVGVGDHDAGADQGWGVVAFFTRSAACELPTAVSSFSSEDGCSGEIASPAAAGGAEVDGANGCPVADVTEEMVS